MVWNIILIIVAILSLWSAWATWQNTKAIKSILKMTDDFNEILQKIIKHTDMHE